LNYITKKISISDIFSNIPLMNTYNTLITLYENHKVENDESWDVEI
jgi:hypothetical protein